MDVPFEIIEHPADVGFIAYGATLVELFQNAALAMLTLACSPEGIEERERREIIARANSDESLLYAWLAEILAVADAEQLVLRRAEVTRLTATGSESAAPSQVRGFVYGARFDRERHAAGTYLKAVTYHQFCIERTPDGWRARVFLDV